MFLSVGIGMSFGDSSAWVAFMVPGIVFLAVALGVKSRGKGDKARDQGRE